MRWSTFSIVSPLSGVCSKRNFTCFHLNSHCVRRNGTQAQFWPVAFRSWEPCVKLSAGKIHIPVMTPKWLPRLIFWRGMSRPVNWYRDYVIKACDTWYDMWRCEQLSITVTFLCSKVAAIERFNSILVFLRRACVFRSRCICSRNLYQFTYLQTKWRILSRW